MPLQRDCASEESRLSSVSGECYYPAQLQYYYLESSANRAVPLLKIKEITKISLLKFHPESSSNRVFAHFFFGHHPPLKKISGA